mgnify:CR=1 FL=1
MPKLTKLKNGIKLLVVPVNGTKAVTVLAMFPIGSRYEHKKISGVSHFVEHLMFKGTARRPTTLDISRELDAVGADYNAFTYKDFTGYYVRIDADKKELAFDMLSDMIFNSKMDAAEVAKEKGVIIEELRMYEDNPTMFVELLFDRTLFGDHPLGWDIGGSVKTVTKITREEIYNYYRNHYFPANMLLVVAGRTNPKSARELVEKYFVKPVKVPNKKFTVADYKKHNWPAKTPGLNVRVGVKTQKVDQAHVILGWPGFKNNHPDRFAATILLNILGGGMSSRLFVEVREKRGLAYMVSAGAMGFRDIGGIYVQAGLNADRLEEALQVIKTEVNKIKTTPVSRKELADAKSNIIGHLALAFENSNVQAEWYAKRFLFEGRLTAPEELIKKLKKVTAKEVRQVAQKYLDFKKMRLAVIGSLSKNEVAKMAKKL